MHVRTILNYNPIVINFSSILVYLIPLSLLTGPFFPDLSISLVSIIFLYYAFKYRLIKYFQNRFFYVFIIFYIYLIINSIFSENVIYSLENSFFYFRFGIFSLSVWFLIDNNKNFKNHFAIIFLITFFYAIFDGYYQYFFGKNLFGFGIEDNIRLSLSFNDKLILGGYLSRLFPILVASIIALSSNKLTLITLPLILILSDTLIYISGERTALGLMMLSTILIIILLSRYRIIRIITLVLSVSVIILLTNIDSDIRDRNINKTIEQFGFSETSRNNTNLDDKNVSERIYIFSPIHESHLRSAWKMFRDSPILGKGVDSFRIHCNEEKYNYDNYSCSTHPHHTYVQLLAETGLIGFTVILSLFVFLSFKLIHSFYLVIKNKTHLLNDYQILLIIAFILTLWPLFPTLNFFNNWINIIYFLPIGFYLHSLEENKKNVEG